MQVDKVGLWVLLGICCAGGLAWALPRELRREYYAAHERWSQAPVRFGGALIGAVLIGIGTGLAFALAGTALGALVTRIVA
jgi:uncharacterized membrane protein YedE/YeeE